MRKRAYTTKRFKREQRKARQAERDRSDEVFHVMLGTQKFYCSTCEEYWFIEDNRCVRCGNNPNYLPGGTPYVQSARCWAYGRINKDLGPNQCYYCGHDRHKHAYVTQYGGRRGECRVETLPAKGSRPAIKCLCNCWCSPPRRRHAEDT